MDAIRTKDVNKARGEGAKMPGRVIYLRIDGVLYVDSRLRHMVPLRTACIQIPLKEARHMVEDRAERLIGDDPVRNYYTERNEVVEAHLDDSVSLYDLYRELDRIFGGNPRAVNGEVFIDVKAAPEPKGEISDGPLPHE